MSLLIAVETRDLAHILLVPPPLSAPTDLGLVDSGGRGGGVLGFPGTPPVMVPLFLVLSSLIGRLGILNGSGRGALRSFEVIPAIHRPLRLDLVGGGMSRPIPLETTLISLPHVETRT